MKKKIIFFELNEVPFRIIDYYCQLNPTSALAKMLPHLHQFETYSEDVTTLSPWKTWPTVHRGVVDDKHCLYDFGQDLSGADDAFPPIWKLLAKNGVKTGVFGSLHTYPLPKDLENYSFYFPDTFAAGSECFPKKLSDFQAFNLEMARESSRNVSKRIPWKSALKVLASSPSLGLKPATYAKVGGQVLSEKKDAWKKVRRRTYQSVLAFDVFMKQLKDKKPDFVTFFTNHVASSMHRYWAACFPEDYDQFEYSEDWVKTYSKEIQFTMSKFDAMFRQLVNFVNQNPDYVLWLSSSMGQEATVAKPLETQLYITDMNRFLSKFGLSENDWEKRPSMMPRFNFFIKEEKANLFREKVKSLRVNDEVVRVAEAEKGFFAVHLGHENLYERENSIQLGEMTYSLEEMGLENTRIEDKSNTTAYHIPQGTLMIYDSRNAAKADTGRVQVSTLELAPTILNNFGLPVPRYMKNPAPIAAPKAA